MHLRPHLLRRAVLALGGIFLSSLARPEDVRSKLTSVESLCQERVSALSMDALTQEADLALACVSCKKARRLLDGWGGVVSSVSWAMKEIENAESLLKNGPSSPKKSGLVDRAYFSLVDRSAQPWISYVPVDVSRKPESGWPSLIFLHGYAGDLNEANWLDMMIPESLFQMAEELGYVILLPFGRGNVDFLGVGERDVLDVLKVAQDALDLDEKRVVLSGMSMGGAGAWCIASHFPDLFAGVVPLAGRSDYFLWKRWRREETPLERIFLADLDYLWARRENVLALPSFSFHSDRDTLIEPEQTLKIFEYLSSQKAPARLKMYEGGSHWISFQAFEEESLKEWLRKLPPRERPSDFSYATLSPDYGEAFGVSIFSIQEWTQMARVDVQRGKGKSILRTKNVAELRLDETYSGTDLQCVPLPEEKTLEGTQIRLRFSPTAPLRKRPGLCGPIRQVYAHPFLMVYGRGASLAQYGRARDLWRKFAFADPPACRDLDLKDADVQRYHLILFGSAEENDVVKRISGSLPIRWADGIATVGDQTYEGPDLGFSLVYPNPLCPDRLLVWQGGSTWGMNLESNHILDFLPDYVIFEPKCLPDGSPKVLCAGFFDSEWRLDARLGRRADVQ